MKKMIMLLVILGMASVSQAAVLDLSVDGMPALDEYTLMPSDWLKLDVTVSDGTLLLGGDLAIVLSNNQGHLEYEDIVLAAVAPTLYGTGGPGGVTYAQYDMAIEVPWSVVATSNPQQLDLAGTNSMWNTVGPYTLADEIWFHCDEDTDVEISLVAVDLRYATHVAGAAPPFSVTLEDLLPLVEAGTVLDTITVHQIPEPMTMSLLALGGLGLLRRRRA